MPRARKPYPTRTACEVDDKFFKRAGFALGVQLNDNVRALVRFNIENYNRCERINREWLGGRHVKAKGRPSRPNVHVLVDELLSILEGEANIVVRASKRPGKSPEGSEVGMPGPVPAFLRVVWDAIESPDRNADGFARLASMSPPWFGETVKDRSMAGRRALRANGRKPRDEYIARNKEAWKSR